MKPLAGIRIIDLSMGWAGPLACRHAADLGAEVIKVESCERFDWWRSWEATPEWIEDDGAEKSTAFNMVNRNKKDITLDLEHPTGRKLLLELVATANAVVENYSGGVLPKLQLTFEDLQSVNPEIILLSMPPFGSTGPWAEFRAYGSTVEQSSGLPHQTGSADDPPTMQHVAYGDAAGGMNGAAALMVALRHQQRTGKGQFVDLSQVEGLFPLGVHGILEFAVTGKSPERRGNSSTRFISQGVYPCEGEDQWIVIQTETNDQWDTLCRITGSPEATDERIGQWTKDKDATDVMFTLQEAGIPAACTNSARTLIEDPQLNARSYWQWLERPVVGLQPNPGAPYRALNTDGFPIASPAPTLGQHNREVLQGILNRSDKELEDLEWQGIIGTRPRMPRSHTSQEE